MGGLFSKPKIPAAPPIAAIPEPPPPAPMPDPGDLQIKAQKRRKAAGGTTTGRLSTMLSEGSGEPLG